MVITIDVSNPDNDVKLVGLEAGQTPEVFFGVRGYTAYRLFNAAARLFFLATLNHTKPDILAATSEQVNREATFIKQRLDELTRSPDKKR